jgi:uncharacterized Zn-finger protein
MEPEDPIYVETATAECDGGDGSLGHPRVTLEVAGAGQAMCPYCSRHFILAEGARVAAH